MSRLNGMTSVAGWLTLLVALAAPLQVLAEKSVSLVLLLGPALSIPLQSNHPQQLAVRNPSGRYIYLVADDIPYRLMSEAEFALAHSLELHNQSTFGTMFVEGKPVHSQAFSDPGVYLVYLADNLETEPENTNSVAIELEYKWN